MSAHNWSPSFQTPSQVMQRQVSDDTLFDFDMNISASPSSMMSDRGVPELVFGSLASISENSRMAAYPPPYTQHQQQQATDMQQTPFSFSSFGASNTMPTNNHLSLLTKRLNAQSGYPQTYGNTLASSPVLNQPSFNHSAGQGTLSPIHQYMGTPMKANEQDQYLSLKLDEDFDLSLLSPDLTSPTSDWSFEHSQAQSQPMGIPINKPHGRTSGMSNSVRSRVPYSRPPSYGGVGDMISSMSPPSTSYCEMNGRFAPNQQMAATNIFNYKLAHPNTAIPASYITAELAEVQDSRGWCLIGNCGLDRARQKANPHYEVSKDTARKRLDHLYDHIRDKHFDCRPFRCLMAPCTQAFSREHDLKRHERTHSAVSLPCDFCGKHYTRDDNLRRHVQLKHSGIALSLPQMSRVPLHTSRTY